MLYFIINRNMGPLEACKETQNTEAARSKATVIIGLLKGNNEAHGGISDIVFFFLERLRTLLPTNKALISLHILVEVQV